MDMFMDKLSEKLNAQEMIWANTSAEVEELGKVKGQIDELKNTVEQVRAEVNRIQGAAGQTQAAAIQVQDAADQTQAVSEKAQEAADQVRNAADQVQTASEKVQEAAGQAQDVADRAGAASGQALAAAERAQEAAEQVKDVADRVQAASEKAQAAAIQVQDVIGQVQTMTEKLQGTWTERGTEAEPVSVRQTAPEQVSPSERPALDEDILYILEEETSQLGKDVAKLQEGISGFGGGFSELKEGISGFGDEFSGIKLDISGLKSEISELEGLVIELGDQFSKLREGIAEAQKEPETVEQSAVEEPAQNAFDNELLLEMKEEISRLHQEFNASGERQCTNGETLSRLYADSAVAAEKQSEWQAGQSEKTARISEDTAKISEKTAQISEETVKISEKTAQISEETAGIGEKTTRISEETARISEKLDECRRAVEALQDAEPKNTEAEDLLRELRTELTSLDQHLTNVSANSASRVSESTEAIRRYLTEQLDKLRKEQAEQGKGKDSLDDLRPLFDEIKALQDEKETEYETKLTGVHEGLREGYHKECVKVYRNVQAAFIEENQKQSVQLEEAIGKVSGKFTLTTVFAILGFVMGLASVVLQILSILKIL